MAGFELGERVVLNPGIEAGGGRIHVIGEHGDGTNAELIAVPATNVHPIPERAELRGGGRVPARLRDRLPDARDARRPARGRVGARLGHRRRSLDRGARDREGARRERPRHVLERREARAGARARRGRDREPRDRRREGGGAGGDRRPRHRRRRRARRRGDVGDVAPGRGAGRRGSPSAAPRPGRTRRRHCTGSGGSSSRSSAPRWAPARTSRARTSSSRAAARCRSSTRCCRSRRSRAAHERLEAGEQLGKIVLTI